MARPSLLLALLLCVAPGAGAEETDPGADDHEALLVAVPDAAAAARVRALGLGFVEGTTDGRLRFHGPPGSLDAARTAGLDAVPAPALRSLGTGDLDAYHDPDEVEAVAAALTAAWPDRVTRVDLGRSTEGRPIFALRIGGPEATGAGLRLVGGHHGDEWASVEVALEAAERLAAADEEDPTLATALATRPVWVLPLANPDGHALRSRYSATAVDLNRNYDLAWTAEEWRPGSHPFSEPETRAVRALHARTGAGAGLSFHSGEINIGWVWNHTVTPTPEAEQLEALAGSYADAVDIPGFWQTNGADWYRTWGDTTDWAYGRHGTLDYTVEVSREKTPPAASLPALRAAHWQATRAFLLAATAGPSGRVVDAETGAPVPASLAPIDGAVSRQTGPDGAFHLVGRDTVELTVRSPGLVPQTVRLSTEDPSAELPLARGELLPLWPEPRVLAPTGGAVVLRDPDGGAPLGPDTLGAVSLSRPDADPLLLTWDAGAWRLPSPESGAALAPGAWDLSTALGTAPRALLVESLGLPTVDATWEGDELVLAGLPEHRRGAVAWVFSGELRAPTPLLPSDDGTSLRLDLRPWAERSGPVDLLVHAGDAVLPLDDLFDAVRPAPLDSGVPAGDTGGSGGLDSGAPLVDDGDNASGEPEPADRGPSESTAAGCASVPAPSGPVLLALPLLLLLPLRRRS